MQLLHGDGGGGAADAGGAHGDLFSQQGAGIDGEFAILGHEMGVVKQGRDLLAPARIAGQNDVAAHIALHAVDMELFVQLLHRYASLMVVQITMFNYYTTYCRRAQMNSPRAGRVT